MGLFMQYGAIGVIYGLIPALSYPIFTVYLNLEGYQTAAYSVLVTLGWSYKLFFGALSKRPSTRGFGLNGANYKGSFSFSMAPNVPYGLCLIPCVLVVISTFWLVVDKKHQGEPVRVYAAKIWDLLQQRAVWQICAFRFVVSGLQAIGVTATSPVSAYWAKVEPLNDSLSQIIGSGIYAVFLFVVGKWGLHWNWRYCIAIATLSVIVIVTGRSGYLPFDPWHDMPAVSMSSVFPCM
ncbi:hypothetical protein AC1031_004121 [Aphanomyces cochlioides]|nr:hypothetical protein AC1031_004121 [Aphanomyces cochlioides]